MSFVSCKFLIFFPLVTAAYFLLPRRAKPAWLLAASYFFYMCWRPEYAALMAASTLVTWLAALLIGTGRTAGQKRLWAVLSAVVELAILGVFKYAGFFADTLAALGLAPARGFDILVPVGISFYTFQSLGYVIDVYRGKLPPEKNPVRYALFVSFFPQLVAGPIERADALLPQLSSPPPFAWTRVRRGLLRMCWGFFTKLVIADRLAPAVDEVFSHVGQYTGLAVAAGAALFAVQIYCDFGGYTSIAVGAAEVLGIKLSENFRQPYLALGMTDYWRRWHMTLTRWFQSYVYMPMVLSRPLRALYKRRAARYGRPTANRLAILLPSAVTWLLTGLWHGAAWHFVLWGVWHGLFCVLEGVGLIRTEGLGRSLPGRLLLRVYTLVVILIGAVLFRAGSTGEALSLLADMLRPGGVTGLGLPLSEWIAAGAGCAVLLAVDIAGVRTDVTALVESRPLPLRWLIYLALVLAIVIFGVYGPGYDAAAFIYFQF